MRKRSREEEGGRGGGRKRREEEGEEEEKEEEEEEERKRNKLSIFITTIEEAIGVPSIYRIRVRGFRSKLNLRVEIQISSCTYCSIIN